MQLNSLNANLTSTDIEKAQRWDRREGPELQLVMGGAALVVLARGESAESVLEALKPLLGEITLTPAEVAQPFPRPTVEVTTGMRSAGGS